MYPTSHRDAQISWQRPDRRASIEHPMATQSLGDIAINKAKRPGMLGMRHGLGSFARTTAPPAHVAPYLGTPEISELYQAR